jgi:hypothetical protein
MDHLGGTIGLLHAANFNGRHSLSLNSGYGLRARFYRLFPHLQNSLTRKS